jgi:hypothetical protein
MMPNWLREPLQQPACGIDEARADRARRVVEGDHQIVLPIIARQLGEARGVPRFREGRL